MFVGFFPAPMVVVYLVCQVRITECGVVAFVSNPVMTSRYSLGKVKVSSLQTAETGNEHKTDKPSVQVLDKSYTKSWFLGFDSNIPL